MLRLFWKFPALFCAVSASRGSAENLWPTVISQSTRLFLAIIELLIACGCNLLMRTTN